MKTVYVVVGHNRSFDNISARAAYSTRAAADLHLADPKRMWFDDRAVVVELEVDAEGGSFDEPGDAGTRLAQVSGPAN